LFGEDADGSRDFFGLSTVDDEYDLYRSADSMAALIRPLKENLERRHGFTQPFLWIEQTPKNVLAAATLLVALVLLFIFESPRALLAVAAVGAVAGSAVFIGLWITGSELNVASLMGLTMVVGITAETAIFFLSQWSDSRAALGGDAALLEAGRTRLRPILMTGLAAALALLPLALGIGRGSAMLQPLAIAILSGLVATVPAVLLLLPPLLAALERRDRSAAREP